MKRLLNIEEVGLTYHSESGETVAVKNMDLHVYEGEFAAVIGPSGCGKTTLLGLISGLLTPSEGKVLLGGKEVGKRSGSLGYMLQRDHLFPWLTVKGNVLLPLKIKKIKTPENVRFALDLLKKYGLEEFADRHPDELSGGMRQRVALIRTLAAKPELLLLDEPFSALDYQTRLSVCDDVWNVIRSEKKTTVLVTHDISEAVSVADRIFLLSKRPAHVRKIYDIGFKDLPPIKRRERPEFRDWFETLWGDLNVENQR